MTGFGIYLVIVYVMGLAANLYYIGRGGVTHTPGTLAVGAVWGVLNILGIIFFGTGLGV